MFVPASCQVITDTYRDKSLNGIAWSQPKLNVCCRAGCRVLNTAISADYSLTAKAWQKDWFSLKAAKCCRGLYWICKIPTASFHLNYEALFENFILNIFKRKTRYICIKHFSTHTKALLQGIFGRLWICTHHLKI